MDDRRVKLGVQHAAISRHEKFHALRQAIHVRLERAQFIAQRLRQHRDDAVYEVSRVTALARLFVECSSRLDVMRHVRDVHPQPPLLRRNIFETDGVVEILRVVGINRDDVVRAAIKPAG